MRRTRRFTFQAEGSGGSCVLDIACSVLRVPYCVSDVPTPMKSVASQSSSSGWEGHSPLVPKSSAVFTRRVPKNCCQKWLTVTRAVRGCFGSTSQRAKLRRLVTSLGGKGGRTEG